MQMGWVKLNVDGVGKNSRNVGCEGLVRNEKCEMIVGFAKSLSSCNAFMV